MDGTQTRTQKPTARLGPNLVLLRNYELLMVSGYLAVPIYWNICGNEHQLHDLLGLAQDDLLNAAHDPVVLIAPVGNHSVADAAKFVAERVAKILDASVGEFARTGKVPVCKPDVWRLGPIPH